MCNSWEEIILSWVNVSGVYTQHIDKIDQLSDGRTFTCFLPTDDKENKEDDCFQILDNFIQNHYPNFWKETPSKLQNEDILILYSLLMYHYTFMKDSFMRNKMCSLDNITQIQIRDFLEYLFHKDITKETIHDAIQSWGKVKKPMSPVEVYESTPKSTYRRGRRSRSNTPLQDFLNSPIAKEQKIFSEMRRYEVAYLTERDHRICLEEQIAELRKEKEILEVKKNEEIKSLKETLADVHSQGESSELPEMFDRTVMADQRTKITELREVIKCLDDKCSKLIDENQELSSKVEVLNSQVLDLKLINETFESNCLEVHKRLATKDRECFLLKQELTEAKARADTKNKNNESVEWDYSDMIEDLCQIPETEDLGTTVVDVLLQEKVKIIANLQEELASLCTSRNECNELKKQINEKNNTLQKEEEKLSELRKEIDNRDTLVKQMEDKISNLLNNAELMQDNINEKQNKILNLQEELEVSKISFYKQCESQKKEIQGKEEELLEQKEKVSSLENEVICNKQELKIREEELAKISDTLKVMKEVKEAEKKEIKSLKKRLNYIQRENKSFKEIISAKEKQISIKEEGVSSLQKEFAAAKGSLSEKERDISALQYTVAELQKDSLEKQKNIMSLQGELAANTDSFNELCESLKKDLQAKERCLLEEKELVVTLTRNLQCREEEIVVKTNELAELSDNLQKLQSDNEEKLRNTQLLKEEINIRNAECETLNNSLAVQNEKIHIEEEKVCHLEKENANLREHVKVQTDADSEKQKLIKNLEEDCAAAYESHNKQCDALGREIQMRQKDVLLEQEKNSKLQKDIKCMEEELKNKNEELSKNVGTLRAMRIDNDEKQKDIFLLKENVSNLLEECKSLQEIIATKDEKISIGEMKICSLEEDITKTKEMLGEKVEECFALKGDMEQLCAEKVEEIIKLSEEVKIMKKEQTENQNTILVLQKEIISVRNSAKLELDYLQEEMKQKDAKLESSGNKIAFLEKEIILEKEELSMKLEDIENLTASMQRMHEDNSEMQKAVTTLQDELKSLSESFSAEYELLKKEIEDKEALIQEKNERELCLERELSKKECVYVEKVDELTKMHLDSIEKQNSILNLLEEQKLLHCSVAHEKEELKNIVAEKEMLLGEKDEQILKYSEEIDKIKKDLNDRKDEIISLLKKNSKLDEEISEKDKDLHELKDLKSSFDNMVCENEKLKTQKVSLETKFASTENTIQDLNSKIQSLDYELCEKQKAVKDISEKLNGQVEKNVSLEKESSEREQEVKMAKAKYVDLKMKYMEKSRDCISMKDIYEGKLARLKEQMQTALNKEKEKVMAQHISASKDADDTLKMFREKVTQYHHDNIELRSQVWDLSEKLLKAKEENAKLQKKLSSLICSDGKWGESSKLVMDRHSMDRRMSQYKQSSDRPHQVDMMNVIDESVTYVRRRTMSSRKSIPPGIGQAFPPQDEEGEEFNAKYLADMKAGRCFVEPQEKQHLSEFQHRNSMVLPHLKSSYPVTDCRELLEATEEDVKFGVMGGDMDNFDTLSTSCLLPDRKKNKDRGQTSYKKPGPPTPGKNGGRLSLQGLEQGATPRPILREQNDNSINRKGTTPSRLRMLFSGKTNRRDENSPITPHSRGLGFFRKTAKGRNHPF